jgi:hypothetical protein
MEKIIVFSAVLIFLLGITAGCFAPIISAKYKESALTPKNYYGLEEEFLTIHWAAMKNNCSGKLFSILLAIRKAENGPAGFEFGVVEKKDTNLDTQARWAAATVVKNYQRWKESSMFPDKFDTSNYMQNFVNYLANKYCPVSVDPEGNENWKKNVWYWYQKFEAVNAKS